MKKLLLLVLFYTSGLVARSQDTVATHYSGLITENGLKEYLSILASDALEGRETGTRGQKMAAAFIAYHFEDVKLGPANGSYLQPFELYAPSAGETYVKAGGILYDNLKTVAYSGSSESGGEVTTPVIFVGKGREQDLQGLDLQGKAVLVMMSRTDSYNPRDLIREKGATMIFMVSPKSEDFAAIAAQINSGYARGHLSLEKYQFAQGHTGTFYVSQSVAEKIFETPFEKLLKAAEMPTDKPALKKIRTGNVTYKTSMGNKVVRTENVLGFLEGTDKKDEVIVITAHYDHIGKKKTGTGDLINNGADDDGSGTSAVMLMARVFAQAKADGHGPRRSILFMTVSAEEKGLFGSEYYTKHPVYPLQNTVVNLNIDMIGRRDAQHKDSPPYVYVIGADKLSTELHKLSERVNNTYTKLLFDYTYNDQNHPDRLYYRSDHWNFAQNNIPIIFYFDGIHEDYHRVTDEVDKIEFGLLAKRTQCIFHTAWEIANREERIVPDVK